VNKFTPTFASVIPVIKQESEKVELEIPETSSDLVKSKAKQKNRIPKDTELLLRNLDEGVGTNELQGKRRRK
jgi:hypothetical protein